jgi:hypothetical protein
LKRDVGREVKPQTGIRLKPDPSGYAESVKKAVWQTRMADVAARYGDQAPMATVCCNACRTCTTTNLLALATGAGLGAVYAVGRFAKRIVRR